MAGHERVHQAAVMPFSWVGAGQQPQQSWLAECPYAGYSGMALPPPLHNALQHAFTFAPPHHAATSFAPPAKKATLNPYVAFCREQRPFLPTALRNAEREQVLGMRWKLLFPYQRAAYQRSVSAPAPVPARRFCLGITQRTASTQRACRPPPQRPLQCFGLDTTRARR